MSMCCCDISGVTVAIYLYCCDASGVTVAMSMYCSDVSDVTAAMRWLLGLPHSSQCGAHRQNTPDSALR